MQPRTQEGNFSTAKVGQISIADILLHILYRSNRNLEDTGFVEKISKLWTLYDATGLSYAMRAFTNTSLHKRLYTGRGDS